MSILNPYVNISMICHLCPLHIIELGQQNPLFLGEFQQFWPVDYKNKTLFFSMKFLKINPRLTMHHCSHNDIMKDDVYIYNSSAKG